MVWIGLYCVMFEYFESCFLEDFYLVSVIFFLVFDWVSKICKIYDDYEDDVVECDYEFG